MSAVDDEERVAAEYLESAVPYDVAQSLADARLAELPAPAAQNLDRRQDDRGVVELMPAEQRELQLLERFPVENLTGEVGADRLYLVEIGFVESRADPFAALLDDSFDRRRRAVEDGVAARLDDSGFGRGDLLERVA